MTTRGEDVRADLMARTRRSAEIAERSSEIITMGAAASLEMPHVVFVASSDGARVTDADDNTYIDCQLGFGTHVLGHRHPAVVAALHEAVDRGFQFGIHNPDQERLAALLCEAVPAAEGALFCNSGTEATMYAQRVARAFTGREKVATFEGAYHGAPLPVAALAGMDRDRHRRNGGPRRARRDPRHRPGARTIVTRRGG